VLNFILIGFDFLVAVGCPQQEQQQEEQDEYSDMGPIRYTGASIPYLPMAPMRHWQFFFWGGDLFLLKVSQNCNI